MTIKSALDALGIIVFPLKKIADKDPNKAFLVLKTVARKAYRLKALETHPDRNGTEKVNEFRQIIEAWDFIDKNLKVEDLAVLLPEKKKEIFYQEASNEEQENIFTEIRDGRAKVTYIDSTGMTTILRGKEDDLPRLVKEVIDLAEQLAEMHKMRRGNSSVHLKRRSEIYVEAEDDVYSVRNFFNHSPFHCRCTDCSQLYTAIFASRMNFLR